MLPRAAEGEHRTVRPSASSAGHKDASSAGHGFTPGAAPVVLPAAGVFLPDRRSRPI